MNKSATTNCCLLRNRFLRQCLLLYLPVMFFVVVFTVTTRPNLNEVVITATPLVHSTHDYGDAQDLRQRKIKTYCR